jgi:2-isopropylmalate synthase
LTRRIDIFDTTLRDGEQSPGAHMDTEDKLSICRQLLRLGVDCIEAGFPASSPGDFASVAAIAHEVADKAVVCALSRALPADIEAAARALDGAVRPRLHTGLGISDEHLRYKLGISADEAIERAADMVKLARNLCADVQFYAEDAGRSDLQLLCRMLEAVIKAGASVVNIPDTTGFCLPDVFGSRIRYVMEHVRGIEGVTVAVHTHNDLGLATALALAGIANGASQVECTVNGIGERAGNAALEEVVMAIDLHGAELDAHTGICTSELTRTSRLVSQVTGIAVQPNKAVVGANAFAHSSGIHQDGVLKNPDTYEILDPAAVGVKQSAIVLTARSGHHALLARLGHLGFELDAATAEQVYDQFLAMADKKREVYDEDLEALMAEYGRTLDNIYTLKVVQVSCGAPLIATATVVLVDRDGAEHTACRFGTGPIDAAYKAVDTIVACDIDLQEYSVQAITRGIDALGEVTVRITNARGDSYTGRGADGDIIVSSTKAYVNALNRMLRAEGGSAGQEGSQPLP